jgi:hypothetical protein
MAETSQILFSYKEVVESLLKREGINEGIWALFIKFGLSAANTGPSESDLHPTALVPLLEIGIQRADKETNIAVDASKLESRRPAKAQKK